MNPKLSQNLVFLAAVAALLGSVYAFVSFFNTLEQRQILAAEKIVKNEVKIEAIEDKVSLFDQRLIRIETKIEGVSETLSEIKDEIKGGK